MPEQNRPSIFILLPDGVGLRNFAYSNFPKIASEEGFRLTFWNNTPFDLQSLGLSEIKIRDAKPRSKTDLLRRARSIVDLSQNVRRTNDPVYDSYRQRLNWNGLRNKLKSYAVTQMAKRSDSETGLEKLRAKIKQSERKSRYYAECVSTLKREKPALVFCTNQRPLTAIAPILAAQDLGIPTVAFIFSWDNVPKATMVIEADFYMVWSEHMKQELQHYYPYIPAGNIIVTGTPQFETHFDASLLLPKSEFFSSFGLDPHKKYICYSGDDITTSPNDPQYLSDVADAVRELNSDGENFGIVFRRCPVDFSDRFDAVLQKNQDIITSIAPDWKRLGSVWNAVLPQKGDLSLQANTIAHTEMVVNLGSSMVFDYAAHGKPCAFVNYEPKNSSPKGWPIEQIYNFVHFRSMPNRNAVVWLDDPAEIAHKIKSVLADSSSTVASARQWFEKINMHPPASASQRIVASIKSILACTSAS